MPLLRTRSAVTGLTLAAACLATPLAAQAPRATVREFTRMFPTYPFSDPNPIPVVGRIYPYFRFDGFTDVAEPRAWKVVELENAYLKVWILPDIGGKIWNAVDKRTGRSFIYFNQVVKFRDIAMRGPWTSGGIEANYGIIGHTPNVATPVDYVTRTNPDGSVSCIVGALDLLTRTPWRLEIRLGACRRVVQHHLLLVQRLGPGAALLLLDERRHSGARQSPVRLSRDQPPGPRRRTRPLADRHRGARPLLVRAQRLRRVQVVPRLRAGDRLLRGVLARRQRRHGAVCAARREGRQEDLDLGPLPAGDDLGTAADRHRRPVRRGAVGPALQPDGGTEHLHSLQALRVHAACRRPVDGILVPRRGHRRHRRGEPARRPERDGARRPPGDRALSRRAARGHRQRVCRESPAVQPVRDTPAPRGVCGHRVGGRRAPGQPPRDGGRPSARVPARSARG